MHLALIFHQQSTLRSLALAMKINNLPELSNRTSSAGNVTLRTCDVISGEVFHSKHDRVSEIHASGGMSTSSSTSLYQGTGSARSEVSFSFETNS